MEPHDLKESCLPQLCRLNVSFLTSQNCLTGHHWGIMKTDYQYSVLLIITKGRGIIF